MMHRSPTASQWHAIAAKPELQALLRARRRFAMPATIFFISYYLALPISVGFFPQFMSQPVWGPLTLAYCFALSQFAMAWILAALYLWRARSFDLAAAKVRRQEAQELSDDPR